MRKFIWKLVIVISILVILVLGFLWYQSDECREERRMLEIKKAFVTSMQWETDPRDVEAEFYGTYDGCTPVYFYGLGATQAITHERVGPHTFTYPTGNKIIAYKNGVFKSLQDAYSEGWLDDKAVLQILQKHTQERSTLYAEYS